MKEWLNNILYICNMETRTVKFNLKSFIEQYSYLYECCDKKSRVILLEDFDKYYSSCTYDIRKGIQSFLLNNSIAKQYSDLQDIATRCNIKN